MNEHTNLPPAINLPQLGRVVRILIAYRPSFLDRMVDRFLETWFEVRE